MAAGARSGPSGDSLLRRRPPSQRPAAHSSAMSSTPRARRPVAQRREVALEVRPRRPRVQVGRQAEPAVQLAADRDVGHRQAVAAHERTRSQMRVEQREERLGRLRRSRRRRRVAPLGGRAHPLNERVPAGRVERRLLPVHPALGIEARRQRLGVQAARRMAGAEVANDHVRLPQANAVVVLDRRHERVRVERAIGGRLHDAEPAAGLRALEREPELLRAPDHLADVDRAETTPDLQHAKPPSLARGRGRVRGSPVLKKRRPGTDIHQTCHDIPLGRRTRSRQCVPPTSISSTPTATASRASPSPCRASASPTRPSTPSETIRMLEQAAAQGAVRGRLPRAGPVGLHLRRPVPPARPARRLRGRARPRRRGDRLGRGDRHRRPAAARRPPPLQLRGGGRQRPRPRRRAQDLPAELRRVLRGAPVPGRRHRAVDHGPPARRRRALRRRPDLRDAPTCRC